MKRTLLLFLIASLTVFSCKEEDQLSEKRTELKKSREQWNKLKANNGEDYTYVVSTSSWTGRSTRTGITVEKGNVTARYFEVLTVDQTNGQMQVVRSYNETSTELNTHTEGSPAITLDGVYDVCASEHLASRSENGEYFFEADENGVLLSCGFVPQGCQDDCFSGVRILSVTWQ